MRGGVTKAMDLPIYDLGAGGPPTVIQRLIIVYPEAWGSV